MIDKLVLSEGVRQRSDRYLDPGTLVVKLVSPEDIFLFKAVAGPVDDIEDMFSLLQTDLDFSHRNHPTPQTVDDIVEALSPMHVVITHQQGAAANQYKDKYDSFVWATDDTDCYTLLDESGWTPPPWVTHSTKRRVQSGMTRMGGTLGDAMADEEMPLPSVTRLDDVDLDGEGLDLAGLRNRLSVESWKQTHQETTPAQQSADGQVDATGPARADGATTGWTPTDSDPDIETALAGIDTRLDRIEAAVTDRGVDARVVDAGDGTLLLRLEDPPDDLEHGQRLRVVLPRGRASDVSEDHANQDL